MPNDHSALAAEVLRRKPIATPTSNLSRDDGVSLVAQALERRRSRRTLLSRMWRVTAAAAAVVLFAGAGAWQLWSSGEPKPTAEPHRVETANRVAKSLPRIDRGLQDGRTIEPGATISATGEGLTRIALNSGTRLALSAGSLLSYDEGTSTHRFSLSRGSVHLEVKKLSGQERFLVNTPDAEVEVRGTVFDVSWLPARDPCGGQTRVRVSEGIVEVRQAGAASRIAAGEHWPTECDSGQSRKAQVPEGLNRQRPTRHDKAQKPSAPFKDEIAQAPLAALPSASPSPDAIQTPARRASDLAEQNDLFARANAARQSGDQRHAVQLYDELLLRFPRSPLAESAQSARLISLRASDPRRARREAQRYLDDYPSGFSGKLAQEILGGQ